MCNQFGLVAAPSVTHPNQRLTPLPEKPFKLPDVLHPRPPRACRPGPPARRGRPGTTARSCTSSSPWAPTSPRPSTAKPSQNPPPQQPRTSPRTSPQHPAPPRAKRPAFDRLARTVRRTIALARKLSEPAREAPGPKLRLSECPNARRPDCAETDAPDAEPWAEPCERPEAADCDADEDLDDDFDDQSFADLIASLRHDTGLATLTDAELRQHRTPPRTHESAQEGVPSERCDLCCARPRPTRPGTGPPRP